MNDALRTLADAVEVADVLDFFGALGWTVAEHPNHRVFVLHRHDDQFPRVEFILPRTKSAVDFTTRVGEVASVAAEIMRESPEAVLIRILQVRSDVVRARVTSGVVDRNSVPLDTAMRIVRSLKDLIAYSATAELTPLPFFSKPAARAVKHANRCRFGHTFIGSFGFTIQSPLAPVMQQPLMLDAAPMPFERRVVERLYRGLLHVEEALSLHSIQPLLTGYEDGFSANMCDALLQVRENVPDLTVEYGVDWSPIVAEPTPLAERHLVTIGPEADEYVQAAAKQLRTVEPPRDLTIEGRVVLLKSDSPPWEDEADDPHTIVVAWLDEHGRLVKTRVILHPSDYLMACDAHKSGRTVSVRGTLERRGKYTRLANPTNFQFGAQMNFLDELNGNPEGS